MIEPLLIQTIYIIVPMIISGAFSSFITVKILSAKFEITINFMEKNLTRLDEEIIRLHKRINDTK